MVKGVNTDWSNGPVALKRRISISPHCLEYLYLKITYCLRNNKYPPFRPIDCSLESELQGLKNKNGGA